MPHQSNTIRATRPILGGGQECRPNLGQTKRVVVFALNRARFPKLQSSFQRAIRLRS